MLPELPSGVVSVFIEPGWCGDEYCNCHYANLYCISDPLGRSLLYSTGYYDIRWLDDFFEEFIPICSHYGLDIRNVNFWDLDEVRRTNEEK